MHPGLDKQRFATLATVTRTKAVTAGTGIGFSANNLSRWKLGGADTDVCHSLSTSITTATATCRTVSTGAAIGERPAARCRRGNRHERLCRSAITADTINQLGATIASLRRYRSKRLTASASLRKIVKRQF